MGLFTGRDRRRVAVVVTADGRRLSVPVDSGLFGVSPLSLIRELGLGLIGLITGSRREDGGPRRNGRN